MSPLLRIRPEAARPRPRESVVAMINIVFLLLIFFLMTAQIVPPDPVEVELPAGAGEPLAPGDVALHVGRDGALAFGAARGEAVWEALAAQLAEERDAVLTVRADAALPGAALATLLPRLAAAGAARVVLVTVGG